MRRMWSLLWLLVACATCFGQTADVAEIAAHSAIIFRGHVLGVVTESFVAPDEVASVRISFRVDDGIRGVSTGETLTIRQWTTSSDEYRAGESLLLFLYAPSALGFTSPVGGNAGHRRPDEISPEALNGLRVPAAANVEPPRAVPVRKPRKLPARRAPEREVPE